MTRPVFTLIVLLLLGTGATLLPTGCTRNGTEGPTAKAALFHCPMHPAVVSDRPGSCPICGMDLVPVKKEKDQSAATPGKTTRYRSTMNPGEVSDQPGKDSMGMDMEAFEVTGGGASTVPGLATVAIAAETRQRMGLRLGVVTKRPLSGAVRTSARIEADETRLYRVTTKVEGWVDKLFVATTGQAVAKGDPLLTLYSPELVSAQAEYLAALAARKALPRGPSDTTADSDGLLAASRQRLELWDISEEQIARLEKTGRADKYTTLYAPVSGRVTERMVSAGQKIMPSEALMVISDLTTLWADADIYQSDLPYVNVGMPVEVTLPYWPGQVFTGRVSFISATLDPMTRTLKARLDIPNPELRLRPEMFAIATLTYALGEKLAVPATAVIFTGTRTIAFRDVGDGHLAPAELTLGARSGDYYEVLAGLNEGDQVVISANFLVDSESSMKAALESLTSGSGSANDVKPGHDGH